MTATEDFGAVVTLDLRHESAKIVVDGHELDPSHLLDDVSFEVNSREPFGVLTLRVYVVDAELTTKEGQRWKYHDKTLTIIENAREMT